MIATPADRPCSLTMTSHRVMTARILNGIGGDVIGTAATGAGSPDDGRRPVSPGR
jgi:hypothetical protein